MTGGRERRIGQAGDVQVLAKVLGQNLAPEDILQQLLVARPKDDVVVLQI